MNEIQSVVPRKLALHFSKNHSCLHFAAFGPWQLQSKEISPRVVAICSIFTGRQQSIQTSIEEIL